MIKPPSPGEEQARLAALRRLNQLDTPAEERLDRITRLTARLFNTPIALISLIDDKRQWFKSCYGLSPTEIPREVSLCTLTISGTGTLVIPDTLQDPRYAHNPLVTHEPYIRFYAGQALRTADGSKVGTLCVMDQMPREMSADDIQTLRDLAGWAENELNVMQFSQIQTDLIQELEETRRQAMIDALTRLWNHEAIMEILDREVARARREGGTVSVIMADIDHFKGINDTYGHLAGNAVLREVATRIRSCLRSYDATGRYGGEEFIVILGNATEKTALNIAEKIRARIAEDPFNTREGRIHATISLGVSVSSEELLGAEALIRAADKALYTAKTKGRNRVALAAPSDPPYLKQTSRYNVPGKPNKV